MTPDVHAGFLYFLPGKENEQIPTLEKAAELGLGYAFESSKTLEKRRITAGGPGGTAGLLVFDGQLCPRDRGRIKLDAQTWRKATPLMPDQPAPDLWVGYWNDAPPRWRDLRRAQIIPGQEVTVDGGQAILIPIARQYAFAGPEEDSICHACALPTLIDMDSQGRAIMGDIVARYRRLWTLALGYDQAWADALLSLGEDDFAGEVVVKFDIPRCDELIDEILKTNYRAGLQELLTLKQYDVQLRQRAVDVLLDVETWNLLQKKIAERLADSESTSSCNGLGEPSTVETAPTIATSPASASGEPLSPAAIATRES